MHTFGSARRAVADHRGDDPRQQPVGVHELVSFLAFVALVHARLRRAGSGQDHVLMMAPDLAARWR